MSANYKCDGCGCAVTTGSRITVSSEGFEWGGGTEHFCSAACLIGRYDAAAGIDNLLKQYKHIRLAATNPAS